MVSRNNSSSSSSSTNEDEIKLETATFGGIEFTGSMAHFLNLQKQGCKVMAMPLQQAHTDVVFSQLEDVDLVLLSLVQGSSLLSLEEALLSGKLENHFSSANIKNGVLFDVINMGEVGSVCNFLMFIPDNGIQAMLKSQDESKKDFAKNLLRCKEIFIRKWSMNYDFELQRIATSPDSPHENSIHSHEHVDRMKFSRAISVFGPHLLMQINEAPLSFNVKELPHGNLDILVVTPSAYSTCTQTGVLIIDETGSMETEASIGERDSERQAVLELLTLAECCNDNLCVLLLANRKEFAVYFYHGLTDILLKTNPIPYQDEEGIRGCFLLSMLLVHTWNVDQNRFTDLANILSKRECKFHCGWAELMKRYKTTSSKHVVIEKESSRKTSPDPNLVGIKEEMLSKRKEFLNELYEQMQVAI